MDDQQGAANAITTEVRQLVVEAREDLEAIPRSDAMFSTRVDLRLAILAGDVIMYVTTKIREAKVREVEGMDPSQAPGSGLIEDAQADRLGSENLAESDSA